MGALYHAGDRRYEKQLRAVCNVLHVPFEFATPAIVEVLSYREDNPSHIAELGGSSDAA